MGSDVSLEMQSDSKNYVGLQDDEITEPVHTIKSACASTGGPEERKKRWSNCRIPCHSNQTLRSRLRGTQ